MSSQAPSITNQKTQLQPTLAFNPTSLPIAQLESLKFKANQIIESIQALQSLLESGGQHYMPSWPDILSKYGVLMSLSHSFSVALSTPPTSSSSQSGGGGGGRTPQNIYERIALHPSIGMTDAQLDNELIPLLRNQQTTDVLRFETATVRRLAEHMETRGVLGVMQVPSGSGSGLMSSSVAGRMSANARVTHADVLTECVSIREAHDRRVERAVRAVTMLKDKFDWKQRVEIEIEEQVDEEWNPHAAALITVGSGQDLEDPMLVQDAELTNGDKDSVADVHMRENFGETEGEDGQSGDEEEVEGELVGDMGDGEDEGNGSG